MAAVGIDLGSSKTCVGSVINRTVEILLNEASNRFTPSTVGFTDSLRFSGESAKCAEVANFRNTIKYLKRLLGKSVAQLQQQGEFRFINCPVIEKNGEPLFEVQYRGEKALFTAIQLMGMYLSALKHIGGDKMPHEGISNCVIAVPVYWGEVERRSLLDACAIAGINPLKLLNECSAVALEYGIYRAAEFDEANARNVVFVDVGCTATTVTVASFLRGRLEIKATAADASFGGRTLDAVLYDFCCRSFLEKYQINVEANPKARLRLLGACEKAKRILSANSVTTISVESIIGDVDASCQVSRDQLEEMILPAVGCISSLLQQAIAQSALPLDQIHVIELTGGTARVPLVRSKIADFFSGRNLCSTLNFDEAIANGCTMQCAMLSPSFRVKEFLIRDFFPHQVRCCYEATEESPADVETILFPLGCAFPSLKELTFKRSQSFEVSFVSDLNLTTVPLSKLTVDASGKLKARVRLNQHGLVVVESVVGVEESTVDETDAEGKVQQKRIVTTVDAAYASVSSLPIPELGSSEKISRLKAIESEMAAADSLIISTSKMRNSLEQFVYTASEAVSANTLGPFASPEEVSKFLAATSEAREWLEGDEGYSSTLAIYTKKLADLDANLTIFSQRKRQLEDLAKEYSALEANIRDVEHRISQPSLEHLTVEDRRVVAETIERARNAMAQAVAKQSAVKPWEKQPFSVGDLHSLKSEAMNLIGPILSKPKPVPIPEPSSNESPKSTEPMSDISSSEASPSKENKQQ